jgi:beta-galactosidase/beta-glucuronidase
MLTRGGFILLMMLSFLILENAGSMKTRDQGEQTPQATLDNNQATLAPSTRLIELNGVKVLLSNGIPLPSVELQNGRTYLFLNGSWKYWASNTSPISLQKRDNLTISLIEKPSFHLIDFEDSDWPTTSVPSSLTRRGGPLERHEGVIWYRTKFFVPIELENQSAILVFTGSNYITDIWLNEIYVGYHEGGFTTFAFEVSEFLKVGGDNLLAVRVDNVPWGSTEAIVPYKIADWWNYGGILRDVYLMFVNKIHVARAEVRYSIQDMYTNLSIAVTMNNFDSKDRNVTVIASIEKAKANSSNMLSPYPSSLRTREEVASSQAFNSVLPSKGYSTLIINFSSLQLEPWSPENPSLYLARITVQEGMNMRDEFFTQFGVRKVEFGQEGFKLNGMTRFLKGVARHEDYPILGRTVTNELVFQDLKIIKEMGADFLRTAHYPNHYMTYILTDRLGIMVWEEIPVYWFSENGFRIQEERKISYQMAEEMIFRDFNRPSIVIWGLCNECEGDAERVTYLQNVARLIRSIDNSRLLAEAMVFNILDDTWKRGTLDLPAYNIYLGVFGGSLEMFDSTMRTFEHDQPNTQIIISEFGYWSGGTSSESDQRNYFSKAWNIYSNHKLVSGVVWWTAFDYDSFHTFNTFGALNWDRSRKKLLFETIKDAYTNYSGKKEENIFPKLWPYIIAFLIFTIVVTGYFLAKRIKPIPLRR